MRLQLSECGIDRMWQENSWVEAAEGTNSNTVIALDGGHRFVRCVTFTRVFVAEYAWAARGVICDIGEGREGRRMGRGGGGYRDRYALSGKWLWPWWSLFQVLNNNRTKTEEKLSHFSSFLTVQLLFKCRFVTWRKGITPKICRLCVYVLVNKRSFESFMWRWWIFVFFVFVFFCLHSCLACMSDERCVSCWRLRNLLLCPSSSAWRQPNAGNFVVDSNQRCLRSACRTCHSLTPATQYVQLASIAVKGVIRQRQVRGFSSTRRQNPVRFSRGCVYLDP